MRKKNIKDEGQLKITAFTGKGHALRSPRRDKKKDRK